MSPCWASAGLPYRPLLDVSPPRRRPVCALAQSSRPAITLTHHRGGRGMDRGMGSSPPIHIQTRGTGRGGSYSTLEEGADDDIEASAAPSEMQAFMVEGGIGGGGGSGGSEATGRLWSNVNAATMKHEPGSVVGAMLLVAGTTVGAGILALPAVTMESGFGPSSSALLVCWVYMVATGLLIAEAGSGNISIVSMADRTLGPWGMRFSSAAYAFLHYALLVAYVSRGGSITAEYLGAPLVVGAAAFSLPLAALCYFGSTRTLDAINGGLVVTVVGSFAVLLGLATGGVDPVNLAHGDLSAVPKAIPTIALAFVYHNIIPVICSNLEGDRGKIRTAIWAGTAIPLAMFLAWDGAILGSIPSEAVAGGLVADPLALLRESSPRVGPMIQIFSLLAIATSYIGFTLGLTDFVADAFKINAGRTHPVPYSVALIPPAILGCTYPDAFFGALEVAGVFGVVVLFGVIPPLMSWKARTRAAEGRVPMAVMLPGGTAALVAIGGVASAIVLGDVAARLSSSM